MSHIKEPAAGGAARPFMRIPAAWIPALLLSLVLGLVLAACRTEVRSGLTEDQANLMLSAILKSGLPAAKEDGGKNGFSVLVDEEHLIQALEILEEQGLPRDSFLTMGDVFKGGGMISSPSEEAARLSFAVSQELSETFSRIDGVLTSRVHVVMGSVDEATGQTTPPSLAVFIRHSPDSPVGALTAKIRELAAHSVAGLSPESVSVMLVPTRVSVAVPPPAPEGWADRHLYALLAAALILGVLAALPARRYFPGLSRKKDSKAETDGPE
jgi:type III secretion protein J